MRKNIRTSLAAATFDLAISATSASAAAPTWFDGSDRNQDSRVTWNEFVAHNSNFDKLDENGDGIITARDHFILDGREESSYLYVEYIDVNRSGAVTLSEYNRDLRTAFDAHDRNGNGSISAREVDGGGPVRRVDFRRGDVAGRGPRS
jgi:hypothetical protein